MEFEIIRNSTELVNHRDTFTELNKSRENETSFNFDFLSKWWRQFSAFENQKFGGHKSLEVLLIKENGIPRGIIPLMTVTRTRKRFFKVRYLEFLGQSFGLQKTDIIGDQFTPNEITLIFEYINQNIKYNIISLSYLSPDSIICATFKKFVHLHSASLYIPLKETYEQIRLEIYSKNLRHILNKFNRRIRESDLEITGKVLDTVADIENYKERIISVSLSKLKSEGMGSVYSDKVVGEFYFDKILNHPNPYCCVYEHQDNLLAYNIGFIVDDTVYALDAGYNRDFGNAQKIGLGILAYDLVVHQFVNKYKKVNMGPGIQDYKFRFTKRFELTHTLFMPKHSIKSKLIYRLLRGSILQNENKIKETLASLKK